MPATTPEGVAKSVGVSNLRRVVFSEENIRRRVGEIGAAISTHYQEGESLLVLGLLKGSFIFMADLVRTLQLPLQVDFLVASSYGSGTVSSGKVKLLYGADTSFEGRNLLLLEDIVDSGTTLEHLVPILNEKRPRSLEICALLHKRRVTMEKEARWVGFDCPDEFVVGYGLDHAEDFRHLPFIGSL
ncbi:MAG: hypoxanthine phosphoribosyltransferase [Gemmatimonadales bacterium]|nr:MAG: hypoxanthine phosphoribosyltransferase [Gemmatimonadales bacterium]